MREEVSIESESAPKILKRKNDGDKIESKLTIKQELTAPVEKGENIGTVDIYLGGEKHSSYAIKTVEKVEEMTLFRAFLVILKNIF